MYNYEMHDVLTMETPMSINLRFWKVQSILVATYLWKQGGKGGEGSHTQITWLCIL